MPILKCPNCLGDMFYASDAETPCKHCNEMVVTQKGEIVQLVNSEVRNTIIKAKIMDAVSSGDISKLSDFLEINIGASDIVVSTGDIPQDYEVIDVIFALDSHMEGFFFGAADPSKAFYGVKDQLRMQVIELGGDAVVSCQFEYRVAVARDSSDQQVIEIFAYGTVVKIA